MKIIGNILAFIVAAGILAAIGWGGYIGIKFLVNQYETINPQLAAVTIISSIIMLTAALIIAGAIRSLEKESDKQVHPEKAVLYSRFIENWYTGNHEGRWEQLKELDKHMIIWSSDGVLQEYVKLSRLMATSPSNQDLERQIGHILIEIRKDLGARNKNIDANILRELMSSDGG